MKISKDTPPSKAMSNFFKNTPPLQNPKKCLKGGVFLVNTPDGTLGYHVKYSCGYHVLAIQMVPQKKHNPGGGHITIC